jgi:23S rRNA (adenine2503-C2)-methyltransferase
MYHLLDQSPESLREWFAQRGMPAYRAGQVRRWIFAKRASEIEQMTDLSAALRKDLAGEFLLWTTTIAAHRVDEDGTEKLLLNLSDNQQIECVLLRDDKGHHTCCISTQVGCAMKCAFCATGIGGLARNLTTGEILEQLLRLQLILKPEERLSHIVVMGMGEPLANLDRLLPALSAATAPDGLGISVRRVTVSTVGLPVGIRRLADMDCQYHLAVSLHAPDDELRTRLMPTNRNIGIMKILEAADEYYERTNRRITYEYILLADVNDRPLDAMNLVNILRGRQALVNLIPYNPVAGLPFRTPRPHSVARFVEILEHGGLTVAIRHRKGARINAACGQLRREVAEKAVVQLNGGSVGITSSA